MKDTSINICNMKIIKVIFSNCDPMSGAAVNQQKVGSSIPPLSHVEAIIALIGASSAWNMHSPMLIPESTSCDQIQYFELYTFLMKASFRT